MKRPPRVLPSIPSFQFVRRLLARGVFDDVERYATWSTKERPRTIVVVGDLQRTVLAEQVYLGRRQNDAVRETLTRAITDERPDVLLLLGDLVADGASDREWRYFDRLMNELRERGTAFHALRGNHDYSVFDRSTSEANFFRRFTAAQPDRPDLVRFGDVAYVGLDSNFGMIGAVNTAREASAYRQLLTELDGDTSVRAIIVGSHHPPYSNSRLSNTEQVIDLFAKPFLDARKTVLYLSAHVHSYERFELNGKTFIVSGGGGGPRRVVDVSDTRRWRHDVYRGPSRRPFHYLRMSLSDAAIDVHAMMLTDTVGRWQRRWSGSPARFEEGEAFRIAIV